MQNNIHINFSNKSGFTLVEVLVASFIFLIVTAGVAIFSVYYLKNYSFSFDENQSVGQTQYALTTMVREIRSARLGEDGAWPLAQIGDNTFIFYSDITRDGRSDRIRYFLDGNLLKKGVIEPTVAPVTYPTSQEKISIIAGNINNGNTPIFRYYNGDWPNDTVNNPLSTDNRLLNTRMVKIYLQLIINSNKNTQPFEMTEDVQIRSLKNNL